MRSSPVEVERLFLALMPDAPVQRKISQLFKNLPLGDRCRKVTTADVHVTLVFIGRFPVANRNVLIEHLKKLECASFELIFDRLLFRRRQQMLWLVSDVPVGLAGLVGRLKDVVSGFGVSVEDRSFRSHMTLARKLDKFSIDGIEFKPVHWDIGEFALVRSRTFDSGAEYTVLERFPLTSELVG